MESSARIVLRRVRDPAPGPMPMAKRKRLVCDEEDELFFEAVANKAWRGGQRCEIKDECEPKVENELPAGVVRGADGSAYFNAKWRPDEAILPSFPEAPVFFPDEDEFADPIKYIQSIRADAEPYGICRVVPPRSWRPPCRLREGSLYDTTKFATRVQELHKLQTRPNNSRGFEFPAGPSMTLSEFKNYADNFKANYFTVEEGTSSNALDDFEGEYWRIVESPTEQVEVLYAADLDTSKLGSGFGKAKGPVRHSEYELSGWNLNNLSRAPGSILSFEDTEVSGVTVPWLYIAMTFSSFCWHVEDHFFYSVNYMHYGDPKIWYGVPRTAASMLEDTMAKHLPDLFRDQPDLLQKLVTQFSPSVLKTEGVPVFRSVQRSGDFVITFPRAYHCGFSTGFSCAEAVNFATMDWYSHGQAAVELYQKIRRKTAVSHDKLLFAAVKACIEAAKPGSGKFPSWRGTFEDKSQLRMLLKACKARITTEHSRRTWRDDLSLRKMDEEFDKEERECFHCHFDLHLSAACCGCSSSKFSCLEHVDMLCRCPKQQKRALYRYDLSELYGFQSALEKLVGTAAAEGECTAASNGSVMSLPCGNEIPAAGTPRAGVKESDLGSSSGKIKTTPGKDSTVVVLSDDDDNDLEEVEHQVRVASDPLPGTTTTTTTQLLEAGTLPVAGWCSKQSIYPAGFKSRVLYYSFLNLTTKSFYTSEIVDCGAEEPYFKVTLDGSPHSFVDLSPDLCWQAIQRRLNFEIHLKRKLGNFNVPKEVPVEEVDGVALFGLRDPAIKKVVEALDKKHVCKTYWEAIARSPEKQRESREMLRNLFLKGDKSELWTLHRVLGAEWGKDTWKQCFEVLADVLQGSSPRS